MWEDLFQKGDSFIHKTDPRIRILAGFITAFIIAILKSLESSFLAFFISIIFIILSSLSLRKMIKTLFLANMFIFFLWFFVPFSIKGDTLFHIWKWNATYEGIKLALLITMKCNAILMIIIVFITTIPVPVMGYALDSLGLPNKLTLILVMSYRYIHVIFEEYERHMQALKVRCFKPSTNLHTYKTYAYLIAMVFIKSYERGIRVYQAMILRGFNGRFYILKRFYLKKNDVIFFGVMCCLSLFLLLLDRKVMLWRLF